MQTYTPPEIAGAMRAAGFAEDRIREGVAIVFAESGGRREATNDNPGVEQSVGPWQINLLAHPSVDEACARDLGCATKEAYRISGGGVSWAPWGAFTNGSFRKFLGLWDETPSPSPAVDDGAASDGAALSSAAAPEGNPCAGVAESTINNVRISMGALLRVNKDAARIADDLRGLYPNVAVACLQQIAYGTATAIKEGPDQVAKRNVEGAVGTLQSAMQVGDLLKPENLWRTGFLVVGALLIFFGARLYIGSPEKGAAE